MTRLELRASSRRLLAATVVAGRRRMRRLRVDDRRVGAVDLSRWRVGAWLYHCVERLIVARRINTVRTAARPLQPLLPVMAAIMGLTQSVVRSLSDVTELPVRRWDLPVLRWVDGTRANRRIVDADNGDDELNS